MTSLEELTLGSITLPDLVLLLPLENLLALDIKLGGTSDLALLPRVGQLRYVELWMIKGLSDICYRETSAPFAISFYRRC